MDFLILTALTLCGATVALAGEHCSYEDAEIVIRQWNHVLATGDRATFLMRFCDIMYPNLFGNDAAFTTDETGRLLGDVLKTCGGMRRLSIGLCHVTDEPLRHIVDGVGDGCPHMELLLCGDEDTRLTAASDRPVRRLLTRRPGVTIGLWSWPDSPEWMSKLQRDFPGRVLN